MLRKGAVERSKGEGMVGVGALVKAGQLEELAICWSDVTPACMRELSEALQGASVLRDSSLKHLVISSCTFESELGVLDLGIMLGKNKTLERFTLISNGMIDEAACGKAIACALTQNSSLKFLNLSGEFDTAALAFVMKVNKSVERLFLTGYEVVSEEIDSAIAEMIRANTTLIELNGLKLKSTEKVCDALSINKSITTLVIEEVEDKKGRALLLKSLTASNRAITCLEINDERCKHAFLHRNKLMHERAKSAAIAFILCWKKREGQSLMNFLSKDLVVPIAKMIWSTRTSCEWDVAKSPLVKAQDRDSTA